jgi:hypothetical protein
MTMAVPAVSGESWERESHRSKSGDMVPKHTREAYRRNRKDQVKNERMEVEMAQHGQERTPTYFQNFLVAAKTDSNRKKGIQNKGGATITSRGKARKQLRRESAAGWYRITYLGGP